MPGAFARSASITSARLRRRSLQPRRERRGSREFRLVEAVDEQAGRVRSLRDGPAIDHERAASFNSDACKTCSRCASTVRIPIVGRSMRRSCCGLGRFTNTPRRASGVPRISAIRSGIRASMRSVPSCASTARISPSQDTAPCPISSEPDIFATSAARRYPASAPVQARSHLAVRVPREGPQVRRQRQ